MRYKEIHGHWPLLKAKGGSDTSETPNAQALFVVGSGETLAGQNTSSSDKDIEKVAVTEISVHSTRTIEEV